MAKIQKIITAEISATIIETYADEEAATDGKEPTDTEVKILDIKPDHTNWRKIKDE